MPSRLLLLTLLLLAPLALAAQPLRLVLPTANDALLHGDATEFYMYTKEVRGQKAWWGGKYGFVRNPRRTSEGTLYTRFHEGIDIAPRYRDRRGEPQDTVWAIDTGLVVYANNNARASNYGKYVVVEHFWSGSPFYSLYAHLNRIDVKPGARVGRGEPLGMMGYTGTGIDRERAHLHLEINMLLSSNFDRWMVKHYRDPRANQHDVFNGLNLAGLNVAGLYVALQANPTLTIKEFLAEQEAFFTVLVDRNAPLELVDRYPLLLDRTPDASAQAWAITFTRSGLPIRVRPVAQHVTEPVLAEVSYSPFSYEVLTNGLLSGSHGQYGFSIKGQRYLDLLLQPYRGGAGVAASSE